MEQIEELSWGSQERSTLSTRRSEDSSEEIWQNNRKRSMTCEWAAVKKVKKCSHDLMSLCFPLPPSHFQPWFQTSKEMTLPTFRLSRFFFWGEKGLALEPLINLPQRRWAKQGHWELYLTVDLTTSYNPPCHLVANFLLYITSRSDNL